MQTRRVGSDPEFLDGQPTRLGRREYAPESSSPSSSGAAPPLRRWQALVVVALVAALVAGWAVDRSLGRREAAVVARCSSGLRALSAEYDVRLDAMYDYARPSLAGLSVLMVRPAEQLLPTARAAAARCDGIYVLPWHSSAIARRNADRAYGAAVVQRLVAISRRQGSFRIEDPGLARLRAAAGIPPALGS